LIKHLVDIFYSAKKAFNLFSGFVKKEKYTKKKKWFKDSLSYFKADAAGGNLYDKILLVQMAKDFEFSLKLAAASNALANKYQLRVKLHDTYVYWNRKEVLINRIHRFLFKNSYYSIHESFGNSVVFKNSDKYFDQKFIKNELYRISNLLNKNKPEELLFLEFEGILVGDLIYDSYLRFYHKPTIVEINEDVIHVIENALNIFYNFRLFLKGNQIKGLVNIYTTYIQHGITARLCLASHINVYTVAISLQKPSLDFPYHQINHTKFDKNRILSENQFALAKDRFESRFKGEIDAATNYMRTSAYSPQLISEDLKNKFQLRKRNVVIYMHEFYDSPHINRKLLFPDLYQYLKQTLSNLIDIQNTSVFIKLHPNAISGCKEQATEMVTSFNVEHFYIIDDKVSNLNIIDLKPDLVCTARGTVGIEMAYWGIPTVALFDNIYANFDFVHTCNTTEEYFSIIRGTQEPKIDFSKEKIVSFYYQAYMEQMPKISDNIFNHLSSFTFRYDTYSDDYLDQIFTLKDQIFTPAFIDYYKEKI